MSHPTAFPPKPAGAVPYEVQEGDFWSNHVKYYYTKNSNRAVPYQEYEVAGKRKYLGDVLDPEELQDVPDTLLPTDSPYTAPEHPLDPAYLVNIEPEYNEPELIKDYYHIDLSYTKGYIDKYTVCGKEKSTCVHGPIDTEVPPSWWGIYITSSAVCPDCVEGYALYTLSKANL
jgi:hypothetical protein